MAKEFEQSMQDLGTIENISFFYPGANEKNLYQHITETTKNSFDFSGKTIVIPKSSIVIPVNVALNDSGTPASSEDIADVAYSIADAMGYEKKQSKSKSKASSIPIDEQSSLVLSSYNERENFFENEIFVPAISKGYLALSSDHVKGSLGEASGLELPDIYAHVNFYFFHSQKAAEQIPVGQESLNAYAYARVNLDKKMEKNYEDHMRDAQQISQLDNTYLGLHKSLVDGVGKMSEDVNKALLEKF